MSSDTIPTRYDFKTAEARWSQYWEEHQLFHSEPDPELLASGNGGIFANAGKYGHSYTRPDYAGTRGVKTGGKKVFKAA